MTTLEIISKELPYYTNLCMSDAAKHYGKDFLEHIPKEFEQAQREAIRRLAAAVVDLARNSPNADYCRAFKDSFDYVILKLNEQAKLK